MQKESKLRTVVMMGVLSTVIGFLYLFIRPWKNAHYGGNQNDWWQMPILVMTFRILFIGGLATLFVCLVLFIYRALRK